MNWMDIGTKKKRTSRVWPLVVVACAVVAGIVIAVALPQIIPSHKLGRDDAETTQQGDMERGQELDSQAIDESAPMVDIEGVENITQFSANQVTLLRQGLAKWLTGAGMDTSSTITLTKEPTTKHGATVIVVTVGEQLTPVECAWFDERWTFSRASDVNGEAEAKAQADEIIRREAAVAGQLGVYDKDRLADYLGKECAGGLQEAWAAYATENKLTGSYDSLVELTTVKSDEGRVTFEILAAKANASNMDELVEVTFDVTAGTYEFKTK